MLANIIVLYAVPSGYNIFREVWSYSEFEDIKVSSEGKVFLKGAVINGKNFSTKDWGELDSKLKKVRKWEDEIPEEY